MNCFSHVLRNYSCHVIWTHSWRQQQEDTTSSSLCNALILKNVQWARTIRVSALIPESECCPLILVSSSLCMQLWMNWSICAIKTHVPLTLTYWIAAIAKRSFRSVPSKLLISIINKWIVSVTYCEITPVMWFEHTRGGNSKRIRHQVACVMH